MESVVRCELAALRSQLAQMCALAADALNHATHALLLADVEVAEAVIAERDHTAAMNSSAHETTFLLLAASQPPVAADLRAIVNAIQIAADAEHMAEIAVRVAKVTCRHHPDPAVPAEISGRIAELSALAVALACTAHDVLLSREPRLAASLGRGNGGVDELHRQLLTALIEPEWTYGVAAGVEVALVSQLYERFAEHAVAITERFISQTNGHRRLANAPKTVLRRTSTASR